MKIAQLLKKASNKSVEAAMVEPRCRPFLVYQPTPPSKVVETYKKSK